MKKRFISIFLSVVLLIGTIATASVSAQVNNTASNATMSAGDINVTATNSFGKMITNAIDDKTAEQEQNKGYNIFSVEVANGQATVAFETLKRCTLVVGIYSEDGKQLVTNNGKEVTKDEKSVVVDFQDLPKYFYIRAYLIDTETYRPLCTEYSSPNYTEKMQGFFKKTTDDFDSKKVLNLDDDKTNNFAVFNDDVKLIPESAENNKVTKADDNTNTYVITNADSSITSLKKGDTFSYEYDDTILIVKIASISVNGTTVTIEGENTEMKDIFDYVKIDADSSLGEAKIDDSTCDEGVEYKGITVEQKYNGFGTIDEEFSTSAELNFNIDKIGTPDENDSETKKDTPFELSGSLRADIGVKLSTTLKIYISFSYQYLELRFDYAVKLSGSAEGSIKYDLKLADIGFSPIPGVYIGLTPSFIAEASATIELSGTVSGTVGFGVSSDVGVRNLTSSPETNIEIKGEITVFVGISLKPKIKIISEKIAKLEFDAKIGVEATGTISESTEKNNSIKHTCDFCIDGDLYFKFSLSFEASLFNIDKLTFNFTLLEKKIKIFDFYYSISHNKEFGFGTCPYINYRVQGIVTDENNVRIPKATVCFNEYTGGKVATNVSGMYECYLPNRKYTMEVSKDGYTSESEMIIVEDVSRVKNITLKKSGVSNNSGNEDDPFGILGHIVNRKTIALGSQNSAYIDNNGFLNICGITRQGQLGFISDKYSSSFTRISGLDGSVVESSIGGGAIVSIIGQSAGEQSHVACITDKGTLYTWGANNQGQLGNGKTESTIIPQKIQITDEGAVKKVKQVCVCDTYSACVTEDGKLYTWGNDLDSNAANFGRLGIGKLEKPNDKYSHYIYFSTPQKVEMPNNERVKQISLGIYNGACITESGNLYVWGSNIHGQMGNNTTGGYADPITKPTLVSSVKNVVQVSVGKEFIACITKDGNLYTWGSNNYGQLGNCKTIECHMPQFVMSNVVQVSAGYYHTACVTASGELYTWGRNNYGQLGNGITTDKANPIPTKIMVNIQQCALGMTHSSCVDTFGRMFTWGRNSQGVLGNNSDRMDIIPSIVARSIKKPTIGQINTLSKSFLSSSDNLKTKTFTDLKPNTYYNFYSMMSDEIVNPLADYNLLYMSQEKSDEDGNLTVNYVQKVEYADSVEFVSESDFREHVFDDYINVWSENFEDGTLPNGWKTIDKDGDGHNWEFSSDFSMRTCHGSKAIYSHSYKNTVGALTPDNWLVLPSKSLDSNKEYVLTFMAIAQDPEYTGDTFGVYISTNGGKTYNQLGSDYEATSSWNMINVDLSNYAGKNITIAVVHHKTTDKYILALDCFNLWEKNVITYGYLPYGDLNSDGKINLLDLIALRKYLAKWNIEIDIDTADCNTDDKVNLLDLILLRKYLAKWNVVLGPQA